MAGLSVLIADVADYVDGSGSKNHSSRGHCAKYSRHAEYPLIPELFLIHAGTSNALEGEESFHHISVLQDLGQYATAFLETIHFC